MFLLYSTVLFQISLYFLENSVMTNKSVYELENLSRVLNLENNGDDHLIFMISPDLPDWVSKIALC